MPEPAWLEAMATVLTCRYESGAGRALAFGLPTARHFRITFNYQANGEFHTGELTSAKPIPQGTLFPIHYNPAAPHEARTATSEPLTSNRNPLLATALIGSAILALAWLLILRSCH
jgi:hypothetical protein